MNTIFEIVSLFQVLEDASFTSHIKLPLLDYFGRNDSLGANGQCIPWAVSLNVFQNMYFLCKINIETKQYKVL